MCAICCAAIPQIVAPANASNRVALRVVSMAIRHRSVEVLHEPWMRVADDRHSQLLRRQLRTSSRHTVGFSLGEPPYDSPHTKTLPCGANGKGLVSACLRSLGHQPTLQTRCRRPCNDMGPELARPPQREVRAAALLRRFWASLLMRSPRVPSSLRACWRLRCWLAPLVA